MILNAHKRHLKITLIIFLVRTAEPLVAFQGVIEPDGVCLVRGYIWWKTLRAAVICSYLVLLQTIATKMVAVQKQPQPWLSRISFNYKQLRPRWSAPRTEPWRSLALRGGRGPIQLQPWLSPISSKLLKLGPIFGRRASLPAIDHSGSWWEQTTNPQDAVALKLHPSPTSNCDQDGRGPKQPY